MGFSDSDKGFIVGYLAEFSKAISVYLRRYRGRLGPLWLGADERQLSVVASFSDGGLVARLIRDDIENPVRVSADAPFKTAVVSHWPAVPDGGVAIACLVKGLAGDQLVHMRYQPYLIKERRDIIIPEGELPEHLASAGFVAGPVRIDRVLSGIMLEIGPKNPGGSCLLVGPRVLSGLTKAPGKLSNDRDLMLLGTPPPPWIVSLVSARQGVAALDGLDPDPVIAGRGVADAIVGMSDVGDDEAPYKYRRAWAALRDAILVENSRNEPAIHAVIRQYPWILVDEPDIARFWSQPELFYSEAEEAASDPIEKSIVPDFVYDLHDQRTLVVEIEAATKQLLKRTEETGFQLPTTQFNAATYQIAHYKQIISAFKQEICRQLDKPSLWTFSYLLVAGSVLQKDFDERSWRGLRDLWQPAITVLAWDYYLDRLQRSERASTFGSSSAPISPKD